MNGLEIKNHQVTAKHVLAKLSIRMLLIRQFFNEGQSDITWYGKLYCTLKAEFDFGGTKIY